LALIQPALPILEYFVNYNYIVNELCENKDKPILTCNGKCYLGKQVKENNLLHQEQQMPPLPKLDLSAYPTFILFGSLKESPSFILDVKEKLYFNYKETFQEIVISIFRPPQ